MLIEHGLWRYTGEMMQASATPPVTPPSIRERVESVINWLRPIVQSDGGDVELMEVTQENLVRIKFHGACVGCPSSTNTLQNGIERNIRDKVPEVTGVVAVEN